MDPQIAVVFGLLALSLVLFAWERFSFDVTALIILSVLLLTGIVTPEEGLSGFSNPATVAIAAMFVLTEGLRRTGFLDILGRWLMDAGRGSFWRTLWILMGVVGLVSAFINNTAAVAIFIPVVITVSARMGVSPSKLLIPVSFASMFGGVTTLIGTSTNLLVSSLAADAGLGGLRMFDFTPVGLAFFGIGFLYMGTLGVRWLPARREPEDLTRSFGMGGYITDVRVEPGSPLVGRRVADSQLIRDVDVDVLDVIREAEELSAMELTEVMDPDVVLREGDVLRVRGPADTLERLLDREGLSVRPDRRWQDADLEVGREALVEAVVAPDSSMTHRPVRFVDFRGRFGATLLALRKHGELARTHLDDVRLGGGDSVLLLMDPERVGEVQQDDSFIVVSNVRARYRRRRMWIALAVLVGVVGSAALGFVPIVVSALAGALLLVLTGCLDTQEAYSAVNWNVIFLLAGVLPLGIAMEKTGAAALLADRLLDFVGDAGPYAVLAGFLFITMTLTAVVTNNATAVLLAPVAISAAQSLAVSPWPLLMGVTYAASLSFVTPVGYQTNTLVYGPGGYRFTDFTRVGVLLNLLCLVVGTALIPVAFPF